MSLAILEPLFKGHSLPNLNRHDPNITASCCMIKQRETWVCWTGPSSLAAQGPGFEGRRMLPKSGHQNQTSS